MAEAVFASGRNGWRQAAEAALLAQRGYLLPWAPVALGIGVGSYFALPVEPGPWAWAAVGLLAALALLAARAVPLAAAPLVIAVALVAVGAGLAGWRTARVAVPVLEFRYHGPIEGRIVRSTALPRTRCASRWTEWCWRIFHPAARPHWCESRYLATSGGWRLSRVGW